MVKGLDMVLIIEVLPEAVHMDVKNFIRNLEKEPFDINFLKNYGLNNGEAMSKIQQIYEEE